MRIEVKGFGAGEPIPRKYTGDGDDASPSIAWSSVPPNAQELALIVDDPDAPRDKPFVHWVACNISPDAPGLPEALPAEAQVQSPARLTQGRNDFGKIGYGGPAPPAGHGTHHYHFHLYALDVPVDVKPGCDAEQLKRAIRGHVLAEAEYVGTYERPLGV